MTKLFFFGLFGFFLACSDGGNTTADASILRGETIAYKGMEAMEETATIDLSQGEQLRSEQRDSKIIKTAYLSFESENPNQTYQSIVTLASAHNGFISSDNSGKDYNRVYRNMVVRVPTENFQALVNGISEDVAYFDQKTISRQDVTEEFVDLEARLKAKRELEVRYLELLKQAKNVKEMLEIERELSAIREEIEAKQGRLNYLQDKVSMSTVTIQFYKVTSEIGVTTSYGQKMRNALKGGWDGISMFLIGVLYLWPLFLVIILVAVLVRWILKRNRKKA